jgi:hypothetical protein
VRRPAASKSALAVIDMRYENPLYMAEDASAGGSSSASAEARPVIDGRRYFGYQPA